jgi:hypothetical protein
MVTSLTVTDLGGGVFRLDFASDLDSPTFYVYRDGVLETMTESTSVEVRTADAAIIEVLDDPDAAPGAAYPNHALLSWYPSPGAASYRVEERVAGLWTVRATLEDDGDRGLPPQVVVVQQGGSALSATYTLAYAGTGGVHRWAWTDGTTTAEIASGGSEWLLRIFDATNSITYGSDLSLPEYPPAGPGTSAAGSAWVIRSGNLTGGPKCTVAADRPTGTPFTWRSRVLEDGATHRFRVVPVGQNGNDGTEQLFTLLMVRIPDPPAVTYTYNGAGAPTVTIAAA